MSLPPGSSSLSAVDPTPERDDARARFAPTSSDEESNVLRHYVGVLRRRYLWIVLGLVVGLVGGYISTLFVTAKVDPNRYYKATNTLIAPSVVQLRRRDQHGHQRPDRGLPGELGPGDRQGGQAAEPADQDRHRPGHRDRPQRRQRGRRDGHLDRSEAGRRAGQRGRRRPSTST